MKKEDIIKAYCWIRENNQSISDDVLDLMKDSAIEKLNDNWVKIESEDDFPETIEGLWEVVMNGEQRFIELLKDNKNRLYKDFVRDKITHYKIKQKSLPPIL